MVAVHVGCDTVAGDAKFLREAHAFMAARADVAGDIAFGDGRIGIGRRLDAVDAVAVGADGRELIALRDGLAMDALHEGGLDISVALAAGGRNIHARDGRFWVTGRLDIVGAVAIGADGSFFTAVGDGASVHAVLVGEKRLGADTVGLHEEALPVATAAGGRDVVVVYGGGGIGSGKDRVYVAVAILAGGCCRFSWLAVARMQAVGVGLLGVGVAAGAIHFLKRGVGEGFCVFVAVNAGEHAAVNRMLEFGTIDKEADGFAVYHRGGRGVGVTGEAGFVLDFLCGVGVRGPEKKE